MLYNDSIVALTPSGAGAIAVIQNIRPEVTTIGSVFKSIKNKDLSKQNTYPASGAHHG
jgi:hypothetical protein